MRKFKNLLAFVAVAAMMACGTAAFVACGGSEEEDSSTTSSTSAEESSGNEETSTVYTYNWTSLDTNTAEAVPYKFYPESWDLDRAVDLTLTLSGDGTYEMEVTGYMIENVDGNDVAVGEKFEYGDGMYWEWEAKSAGTYTSTDTTVTISSTYEYYKLYELGSSYVAQLFGTGSVYSLLADDDYYYGEWDSDSDNEDVVAQLKAQFPDTIFEISGNTIVNWIADGYDFEMEDGDSALYFYVDTATYYCFVGGEWISGAYTVTDGVVTISDAGFYLDVSDSTYGSYSYEFSGDASTGLVVTLNDVTATFALTDDIVSAL